MWPFRMPPFAGHPGIPDPGLTTGDWLTLLLTAAIAWAAIQQVFVNRRIFALQQGIEDDRRRVDLSIEYFSDSPSVAIVNLSPFAILVKEIVFTFWSRSVRRQEEGSHRAQFVVKRHSLTDTPVPLAVRDALDKRGVIDDSEVELIVTVHFRVHGEFREYVAVFDGNISHRKFRLN